MQQSLNLGPALMPDFMTGAQFLAILAWPTVGELERFRQVSDELMGAVVRMTDANDADAFKAVMEKWPQHDWTGVERCAGKRRPALGYLEKRLGQRMAAARAGIGKIHDQIFDAAATLPSEISALSIDQLSKLIRKDVTIDDPENVEKLVWRPSLPVIHLAMATQLLLAKRYKRLTISGATLEAIGFYRDAVHLGQALETVVHDHSGFAVTRDTMTRVRWFE